MLRKQLHSHSQPEHSHFIHKAFLINPRNDKFAFISHLLNKSVFPYFCWSIFGKCSILTPTFNLKVSPFQISQAMKMISKHRLSLFTFITNKANWKFTLTQLKNE